ncbi:MAG: hypothetical protein JHC74_08850 [Thermoleophilia bacterium]|nr:hypothetical protein [Thermoleophilia bacterium]
MGSEHHDPRVRRARRIARALGIAGEQQEPAGGAVPLPDIPGLDLPGPWAASDAGREALRWVRAVVGVSIVVLLALGAWERRRVPAGDGAPAVPPGRPPERGDA